MGDGPSSSLSSPPASPTQLAAGADSGDIRQTMSRTPGTKDTPRLNASVSRKALAISTASAAPIDTTGLNTNQSALPAADIQFPEFLEHSTLGVDNMSNVLMHSHNSSPDLADGDLQNLFDCLVQPETTDGFWPLNVCNGSGTHGTHEHCGCLEDPASYHTILELSLRLRRASDILNRFSKHGNGVSCAINQSITDLDRFTSYVVYHGFPSTFNKPSANYRNVLGNIVSPPSPESFIPSPVRSQPAFSGTSSPTYPTAPYGTAQAPLSVSNSTSNIAGANSLSPRSWGFKTAAYPSPPYEDSFMSWEPQRY